ncbi:pyoverdine sidechain peptide synthetase II, D-Asp-L-Thr component, partial [Pseudomonas syringae pv. pisi str. 1704B]
AQLLVILRQHQVLFGALCSGRTLHVLTEALGFDPDAF